MIRAHRDKIYEGELRLLEEKILLMAGHVEEMIGGSVKSVLESDLELARQVILQDYQVNQTEVEIDQLCLVILATRQPMAGDLRFITIALKMVTDLERIGDLAVNISERTAKLRNGPHFRAYEDIPAMAVLVQRMVREAIEAFIACDVDWAQEVIADDDLVDEAYHQILRELMGLMSKNLDYVEAGIHVQSVVKFLERIADHATNLAELVVFMVKGKDIRHLGKRQHGALPLSQQ